MKISIIAAMTSNNVIGTESGLPWDIPAEYNHYLNIVDGKTVIMGRKTYEIFGMDLDPDCLIVVTSRTIASLRCAIDFSSSVELARSIGDEVFVAGGRSIYKEALTRADEMHISEIKDNYQGTVYFPPINYDLWIEEQRHEYSEFVYKRFVRQ